MNQINLIIDTDIGPDCDDAGALACAHALQNRGLCKILAVTHCTSNPYGAGCADAINRWYGRGDIPVGTLKSEGFLADVQYQKYNRYVAEKYPNRYHAGECVPDALAVLRSTLATVDDGSAVICAIGPLKNLANLLHSQPDDLSSLKGQELIAKKVMRLVVMGGGWTGPEWNFQMDPKAAADVCGNWPTEIWFSTFEIGESIITGSSWNWENGTNPVCDAYRLHSPNGRMSWDLTAIWAAVMGPAPLFTLSNCGSLIVDENGNNKWIPTETGTHRYLLKIGPDELIQKSLDDLMMVK